MNKSNLHEGVHPNFIKPMEAPSDYTIQNILPTWAIEDWETIKMHEHSQEKEIMTEWTPVEQLPDFNGKVIVRCRVNGEVKEMNAWYETGDRRFEKGFSLMPKHFIKDIFEWKRFGDESK